ncbi:MAG TPA: SRPBCC family protein [Thermomicrobiaceae bacterium]|nr:SRPBCC family protein [Thermomicrobiaceae bacterium]
MPVQTEPLLLDRYLPHYDVTEVDAVVIDADPETTWQAIRRSDLGRSPVIRALLELRGLPVRLRRIVSRRPAESALPPLTLDEMTRAGFVLLEEVHGREIVLGQISRPWRVSDPADRAPAVGPSEFAAFDRPGFAKIAFNIRLEPYGSGRTLVTTETRTATTDPATARRFGRYWTLIGPFSGLIRRLMLGLVKADAERHGPMRRIPKMAHIEGEIEIARPVEEVFDFVADERNEPRYNPEMLRAEQITDGPPGAGTRFEAETRTRGGTVKMTIEFTEFERPRRIVETTQLSSMEIHGTLTFEPVAAGTRMRWSWDVEPRGIMKLMGPLVARMGARNEQTIWTGLKRCLEGQPASPVHA